jgi:HD superfamily phosphohydrolase
MVQKLLRDPLYDYIGIDLNERAWLLELIDSPELQRLRYVSQLGLGQFTYPGATHSRFAHSLGVLHLMQECLVHLRQGYRRSLGQLEEEALLAAALLHDVGHSPFSHATEPVFGGHEARAATMILSAESGIHKVLRRRDASLPVKAAALLRKGSEAPLWQKSLISSQLDLDRLDYLRRDSLCSGAEYGHFDWFRIVHTMQLREKAIEGRQQGTFVVWPDKSKFAIEEYLFSRFYMYQNVYFHHTTRGYEGLLDRILTRAQDLAVRSKRFTNTLLPPLRLLRGGPDDLHSFQSLTDHVLLAQVACWQSGKDEILADLCRRFLLRRGIGWLEIASGTPFEMKAKIDKVSDYLDKRGKNSRYYFIEHAPKAAAYKPYSSASAGEEQTSVNSIMLYDASWSPTGFREITEVPGLGRLKAITGAEPAVLRYYFPKENEAAIKKLLTT